MQDFLSISNGGVGLVIGVITLVGLFIGSQAIPSLVSWFKGVISALIHPFTGTKRVVAILTTQISDLNQKLSFIVEQMNPNGGTSMRDALNRIEQRQASTAARMEIIIEHSAPMFETNLIGECTWVSSSYADKVKRPIDSLLGWGWIVVVHPDDLHRVRTMWKSAIEDKRDFEVKFRVLSSEGEIFEIFSIAHPVRVNGAITGWVGTWKDVPKE